MRAYLFFGILASAATLPATVMADVVNNYQFRVAKTGDSAGAPAESPKSAPFTVTVEESNRYDLSKQPKRVLHCEVRPQDPDHFYCKGANGEQALTVTDKMSALALVRSRFNLDPNDVRAIDENGYGHYQVTASGDRIFHLGIDKPSIPAPRPAAPMKPGGDAMECQISVAQAPTSSKASIRCRDRSGGTFNGLKAFEITDVPVQVGYLQSNRVDILVTNSGSLFDEAYVKEIVRGLSLIRGKKIPHKPGEEVRIIASSNFEKPYVAIYSGKGAPYFNFSPSGYGQILSWMKGMNDDPGALDLGDLHGSVQSQSNIGR